MTNENLNKLCMDESDPMLNALVRCKHGILLNLQTSWSKLNPGRRFWSCPCYGSKNCKFFRWRDKEKVDPRSSLILPRLVNKINELEQELCIRQVHIDNLRNSNLLLERRLNRRLKWCRFNRKILLCILICVVAMFIEFKYIIWISILFCVVAMFISNQ
ncbi:hypothetical protein R3W88_018658 [Solanum pinnatisectum]|uniref:GRF-type domain-containing protein n=1 Tax=Solanum pinnatisectum TaxID=50273 RepID=A0AAV9L776_9SOLN|nr:hypothetical protein R3W88_018658 [Solanum pinnatisectum]